MPLPGYAYSSLITADTSSLSTTETNIPLAHFLPDMTGKRLQASWFDVVPCLMDGVTVPDFYLEVKADATAVMHVEWPTLTAGQAALQLGYLNVGKADATDLSNEAGAFGSLRARYALSEASGTLYDSTANNNDLTAVNSPTYGVAGQLGNAVDLEYDTHQYLRAEDSASLDIAGPFTLSAWVKPERVNVPYAEVVSKRQLGGVAGNYYLRLENANVGVGFSDGSWRTTVSTTNPLSAGSWYHVAGVYTGATSSSTSEGPRSSPPRSRRPPRPTPAECTSGAWKIKTGRMVSLTKCTSCRAVHPPPGFSPTTWLARRRCSATGGGWRRQLRFTPFSAGDTSFGRGVR